jgi:hypothetical protein
MLALLPSWPDQADGESLRDRGGLVVARRVTEGMDC